ncbi:hypothetical protein LPTSP3_g24400 [Leptospira kobayashii]|uniref:Tetratricopeptide repeat protein n=1 Tax=Leptospira kobayashii TaxID=1917830 RepID=A0ABN6KFF6_9LEPT|nr:tetratricopeptide repeat protein [Leptospira kobayashii]BDA79510.1 hypothetical protein LPTSP3_g24400 [Leptospira kobayashii]
MVVSSKKWILGGLLFLSFFPLATQTIFEEGRYPSSARVLRANVLSDRKSTFLAWEPPKEEGEVIVARANTVIDTPDKLYVADSLGRYKTGGASSIKTFYDYNLKPGTYYYAVVLVGDIRKREVKLFPNQNYTVIPVTIEDPDGTVTNPGFPSFPDDQGIGRLPSHVSNIHAALEKKNVRIDWQAPPGVVSGRTIYTIYRSLSPMTSLPLMQKAQKLAEVSHPTVSFLDQGLEKSQTVYYGVSIKEPNGEEGLPLEDKKSSIRIFYVKDNGKNTAEVIADDSVPASPKNKPQQSIAPPDPQGTLHVRGVGYERVGKGVVMSWLAPEGVDDSSIYSVYASTKPFNQGLTSFGAGVAVKVATVNHPKTNFYIKELKEIPELYFGVTVKSGVISEDFNLKENVSFFRYDFNKDLDKPEEIKPTSEQTVQTTQTPAKVDTAVNEHSVVPPEIRPLSGKEDGLIDESDENTLSTVGYNLSETDLNRILKETVLKRKFELAIDRLEKYLEREKNTHLVGKAYFYLGISHLKSGEYKKALRYFMKRDAKSFSPDRTEFWTNQTLEKLGRGKS